MNLPSRHVRVGVIGLLVLASCFRGPVTPTATLAPAGPDSPSLRSKGPFAVVHAAPKGRVADRRQPGVTVLFSRGVRTVETPDDAAIPAITIKSKSGAAVPGSWRWTGTRGLLFTPETELPGGSDFTVTVPGDVKALDGSVLGKPYVLDLETDGPMLGNFRAVGPAGINERALPPTPVFRAQFDQSVDPNAVLAAATLRAFKGDGDKGEVIKLSASREPASARPAPVPGVPPIPESWVVMLKPDKALPLDHQIELAIAPTLQGTGGPRPMPAAITRTMRTHGPLRFVDFYCPRIEAKGRCKANGDVKVTMSTPVAPEELKAHAKLGKLPPRPPAKPGKGEKRTIDPGFDHWLGVAPKIGEQYKVTLTAGMKDIYGQKLEKDVSFDLVVEAPLVKPAAPAAPPPVASPAAPAPPPPPPKIAAPVDSRPRRERLPYLLDLGITGQVLEAQLATHKVPVGAVNVPTYTTVAAPLSDAQATSWTLARGSTSDFLSRNGLAATWTTTHTDANQRAVDFIDLDRTLAKSSGRGPALLVVAPPGAQSSGSGRSESLVTVTDLGVSAKLSPFGGLVWVTRLSSGQPVASAQVAVRTAKGGEVFAGTTDAQGMVLVPADRFDPLAKEKPDASEYGSQTVREDSAIVVRSGDDWTITRIGHSPVERRLTSGFQALTKEGQWAGMLFADRGVFRPGETAKVSGIVRVVEGDRLRSIAGRELRIELRDDSSEQVFDGRAKCDDFGTFALDLPIPKTAKIGTAMITATAMAGGKSNTSEPGVFNHEIRILAYKPNEFKVAIESDKPAYVRGDDATFTVQGDYLYGAPMQGATVTTTVSRQEVPFVPPNAGTFVTTDDVATGDVPDDTKAAGEIDSQDGPLDSRGTFKRKVSLAFPDQKRPERVLFDADVTDVSRRSVAARASTIVHPGEFYVGLRPPKDRFVAAGAPLHAEVAAIEPSGTRRANAKIDVELVERRWNSVIGEQPDGRPQRSNKAVDTVVAKCTATTKAAEATGCDVKVPHAGYFVLRATGSDPRGNTVRASTSVYGTEESPRAETAWPADDRHGIKLEANKPKYDIGETAKVVLRSPFKEGQALVTVERNGVLHRQVVPIKGPLPVLDVPIKPEFYPNAFVSVVAIRGRIGAPPATGTDLSGPDYRYGWTELKVNQDAHRLDVKVTPARGEYQPGSLVETDVVVRDGKGAPVETALTFYVVDEGVLALTSYVTPDPLPAFVQRRKLSVFTFDNREGLARILPMKAGERLSPLGYEYALAKNGEGSYDKGDDGGGGGLKRADFRTTAYFESGKRTDKSGKAHFSFKLPDNLTTFRVMAVAAAQDDRFGSGDGKVTTFRRLMARPALPRILRVGDSLEASVVLSSKNEEAAGGTAGGKSAPLGPPMNVDVKLDVHGLVLTGPKSKRVTMPRGGQMEVRFPVKATAPGEAVLVFEARDASGGKDVDQVEMKRKVELPVSIESQVAYGETSNKAAIALGDLTQMRPDYGGLDVRVSSSALVGLGTTIDRLSEYPYACTEQLTSKLLPVLSMLELTKESGAKLPPDLNGSIDGTIELLAKRQNSDGGFGFWEHGESDPWLSAYAMLAISGAADRKRFVSRDILESGISYLNMTLATSTRRFAKLEPEKALKAPDADAGAAAIKAAEEKREKEETAKALDYVSAAIIADTLATVGRPNPGAINVLYDARAGQRLAGQAALLHAMAKAEMAAAGQVKTLSHEIESRLRVGPNGIDVDEEQGDRWAPVLDSHARTLALVLRGLLAADPKHPHAARIARRLLSLRQNGAWRTTQEDAWALLALADYRKLQESGGGAIEAKTLLGGDELLVSKFPRGSFREDKTMISAETLLRKGPTLGFEVAGGSPIFFAAELKYATATLPMKPRDEGLFVTKYYRGAAAAAVAGILPQIPKKTADAVIAGELVVVDLLFESAEPREHVVLDDPLPAGLEALDYDIDTTSQAHRDAETKPKDPKATWLGTTFRTAPSRREVRDDRVLTFFERIEPGMYRIQYLARAASIGAFVVPPTRIEAMYEPEVYGRTAAGTLAVRPKP